MILYLIYNKMSIHLYDFFIKKRDETIVSLLVEVTGLEPTTSWSRTKRATKLRYTSKYSQRMLLYYI